MLTAAIGVINLNSDQLNSLVADADYNQTFEDSAKKGKNNKPKEHFYFRGAQHEFEEDDPIFFMAAKNPQHV